MTTWPLLSCSVRLDREHTPSKRALSSTVLLGMRVSPHVPGPLQQGGTVDQDPDLAILCSEPCVLSEAYCSHSLPQPGRTAAVSDGPAALI